MERMQIVKVVPDAYRAVLGLQRYVSEHVDPGLLKLVMLRASIVNGCVFCVDMHSGELLDAGEDVRRVVAVSAWHESPFFTDRERVTLRLTDAVTRLGDGGVPDDVWDPVVKEFGETGAADLVVAIATINVWNRLLVSTRRQPPPLAA
jgi:AhpD family alkylhydroperoxidase